jgi:hypothetical protein
MKAGMDISKYLWLSSVRLEKHIRAAAYGGTGT